jgi:hypothetical protein
MTGEVVRATESDARSMLLELERVFPGSDIVDVRPRRQFYAFPDRLVRGERTVGAFGACADCEAGTWARFDGVALCMACAWERWRVEQVAHYQSRIEAAPPEETPASMILEGATVLARHGGLVEVRILKTPQGTVSGYFDDLEALTRAVEPWDGRHSVYITLNPIDPRRLEWTSEPGDGRPLRVNQLRTSVAVTTSDADILRRVWLPVDIDPVRPEGLKGAPSSEAELAAAIARRDAIVKFLVGLGMPRPICAISGNGAHALCPIDLPNDDAARTMVEQVLGMLAQRFSDAAVSVDTTVSNASRIWKLFGTVAIKGTATAERPHRRARLDG